MLIDNTHPNPTLGWDFLESTFYMGKKLTIYMIDGTEYGPRLGEIGNWVGKALYAQRASLTKIINREEFNNPGIYCLKGDPSSESYEEKIYIGEAENVGNRIKQHLVDSKKDFKEVIFFTSKDELLTKTQIKYLESRLIVMAIKAKTAEIENGNSPSLPRLHEADISDMEYFLEQIKLILPVMGFRFLISSTAEDRSESIEKSDKIIKDSFFIKSRNFNAEMYEDNQGYIVKKGSQAKKNLSNSITETYRKLREKLIDKGLLVLNGDFYIFSEDTVFNSTSAASNIILGRQSNGLVEWVNKNGVTYKDVEELMNN